MERGRLRVYLGVAAGVGTTYAMLDEAIRRAERGTRVMVGCLDAHGRGKTIARLVELTGHESAPSDLDVTDVLATHPDVVLVDELARVDPGAETPHWRQIESILDAGIDVISTLTVQQIESLSDPVADIVGRRPASTVPDEFLSRTAEIELVDISPWAIRRRIAHGNIYGPEELEPLDAELFNTSAFADLRALLMFWMADRLSAGPADPRGAREIVVVALTDSPTSDGVLRRAARLAHRSRARLVAVHVSAPGARDGDAGSTTASQRRGRVEALGGVLHEIVADDVASALVSFARAEHATQLVLGGVRRARWRRATVVDAVLGQVSDVDVHVVSTDGPAPVAGHRGTRRLPVARQLVAALLGAVVLTALTIVLVANRGEVSVATALALYLLVVVGVTAVGGAVPGVLAAVAAPLLANWYLIAPYHTFRVNRGENLLELFVFVSVAAIVSSFVSVAARRAAEAERARREASTLTELAGTGNLELPSTIVEQIRTTFGFDGVAVLEVSERSCRVIAESGAAPHHVDDADIVMPISSDTVVASVGGILDADDHRLLRAFTAQLSRAFEQQHLRAVAAEADALARADELRTAMLRAVSHDLRSPLASIKASVSSIRQPDVDWPPQVRDEFLASIESETDRLTSIVTNLLDLSRLEAGVLRPVSRVTSLEEIVPAAVHGLGVAAGRVVVDLPTDLPDVETDPALLERVVANLVANAVTWSPADRPVRVSGHVVAGRTQIHVVDHGPGIPPSERTVVVQPFHRLGDSTASGGLGLGLAIADRLVVAMGGQLDLRDTPGGGLTAVVSLAAWERGDG